MLNFKWILALSLLLVAAYYIWGYTGKDYSSLPVSKAPITGTSYGKDAQKGNVVAIQPQLAAADYCNGQHFFNALHRYFKSAQDSGWLQPKTLVVMPENIGSWLAFAEEKSKVYGEDSMRQAVATIVNSNIFNFIRYLMYTPPDDKIKHAFVYMKTAVMVRIYTSVFASLAREFKVTIAAGSIILPEPVLDKRAKIRTRRGQLYYAAFVFNPKGIIAWRPARQRLPEYDSGRTPPPDDTGRYVCINIPAGTVSITTSTEVSAPGYYLGQQRARLRIFLGGNDRIWNPVWIGPRGFDIPSSAVQASDDTLSARRFLANDSLAGMIPLQSRRGAGKASVLFNGFTGKLWEIPFGNRLVMSYPYTPELPGATTQEFAPLPAQGRIMNFWFR